MLKFFYRHPLVIMFFKFVYVSDYLLKMDEALLDCTENGMVSINDLEDKSVVEGNLNDAMKEVSIFSSYSSI